MTDSRPLRVRLAALSDDQLVRFARFEPVGTTWARAANVAYRELERGDSRAVRALRARLQRNGDACAKFLLTCGFEALVDDSDGRDALVAAARTAAGLYGPELTVWLLEWVADSESAQAAVVRERLDWLVAEASGTDGEPVRNHPRAVESVEDSVDHGDGALGLPDTDSPVDADSDAEMLLRVDELVEQSDSLAARLISAANRVRSLVPADAIGTSVDDWSVEVRRVLAVSSSVSTDLGALASWLRERLDATARRVESARATLAKVDQLRAGEMENLIPHLLASCGFADMAELWSVAGAVEALATLNHDDTIDRANTVDEAEAIDAGSTADVNDDVSNEVDPGSAVDASNDGSRSSTLSTRASKTILAAPGEAHVHGSVSRGVAAPIIEGLQSLGADPGFLEGLQPGNSGGDLSPATDAVPRVLDTAEPEAVGSPVAEQAVGDRQPGESSDNDEVRATVRSDVDTRTWPDRRGAQLQPLPPANDSADHAGVLAQDFPWDAGDPPLIAALLEDGREALAYHVAVVEGESQSRCDLLRLQVASAGATDDALERALGELIPDDADIQSMSVDEVRVLLAATLRAGLRLGYAPLSLPALLGRAAVHQFGVLPLLQSAAATVVRGWVWHPARPESRSDLPGRWTALADRANEMLHSFETATTNYQRSTRLLHYLVREGQPIGDALRALAQAAGQGIKGADAAELSQVEALSDILRSRGGEARLIEAADARVSTPQQLRNPIVATARNQLVARIEDARALAEQALALRRVIAASVQSSEMQGAEDLESALADVALEDAGSVGFAALNRLVKWMRAPGPAYDKPLAWILDDALVPLYELPRSVDDRVETIPTRAQLVELLAGRDAMLVVKGYLSVGNIAKARGLLTSAKPQEDHDDLLLRHVRDASALHREALGAAEQAAARLKALYIDDAARDVSERIDQYRVLPIKDRYDLVIGPLQTLAREAEALLTTARARLVAQVREIQCNAEDRERVLRLLGGGDEALAVEFLTLVRSGSALPDVPEQHGDDFSQFFPSVVAAAAAADPQGDGALEAVRSHLQADGVAAPSDRILRSGLESWLTLKRHKRSVTREAFRASIADVTRMLGLIPRDTDWLSEISRTQRTGYATYRVAASPVDRSYVPELGTLAHGSYDLTLVWDAVSQSRLFDFIEERNINRANVILYFGVLTVEQRLGLRRLTQPGRKGFSPMIVDDAVVGWLSTRPEAAWRFTQRVTLPFTAINPYAPFSGGEVPDEVFVGRTLERARIEDPAGPTFVYGGRQLGKSALLRRVERMFHDVHPRPVNRNEGSSEHGLVGTAALYVDLKAAGIGDSQDAAAVWPLLADRLKSVGIVPARTGKNVGREELSALLVKWLNSDARNRLLLLMDEADNFLTADAAAGSSPAQAFPELQGFKSVMESTQRRFKPVFAGLHQVQRFHNISNTPVAHGGPDILIGPLPSSDAYRLVVDPMHALGYRFESPELVWRLLLFTNYQASLVQVVCEALVDHVRTRMLPGDGGRIVITGDDIHEVYEGKSVRDRIAERFRWTINLDSRYRVIALVVAWRSLDAPGTTFSADDLHDECADFWPAGFSRDRLSREEFGRYLNEMVGLGVLHKQGDDVWAMRSPNLIRLLGTKDSLERELTDAATLLEPPYEYNPTMNRQQLSGGRVDSIRSPFTDADVADLLADHRDSDGGLHIVIGSYVMGIDRAVDALAAAADAASIRCEVVTRSGLDELIRRRLQTRLHAIVDLTHESPGTFDLAKLAATLGARTHVTATILVGSAWVDVAAQLGVPVMALRRWSSQGLRAWHESAFDTPELRGRLFRVTSGWPKLVEQAMGLVAAGATVDEALDQLGTQIAHPDVAAMLIDDSGADKTVVRAWCEFQGNVIDGVIDVAPAALDDLEVILEADPVPVLRRLGLMDLVTSSGGYWTLDRVLAAAAHALT